MPENRLSSEQIHIALAHGSQATKIIQKDDLLHSCSGLIFFHESLGRYRFSEPSTRRYLGGLPENDPNANHAFAAVCCIIYLSSDKIARRDLPPSHSQTSDVFLDGFHQYPCVYWPYHLSKSEELRLQPPLRGLSESFMMVRLETSDAFTCWSEAAEYGVYGGGDILEDWSSRYGTKVWDSIGRPADYVFVAVAWGFDDVVENRLQSDPNAVNLTRSHEFNSPLLCIAANNVRLDIAQLLLKHGANVQEKDGFGETALMIATKANDVDIVRLLLQSGATAEQRREDAVRHAAQEGRYDVLLLMLEQGLNIEGTNEEGMTALDLAVEEGHEDFAQLLLKQEAYTDQSKKNFWLLAARLQRAVKIGDEQSLQRLLEEWQGNEHDWYLGRVLWKASQVENEALVKMLLQKGADPNTVHYGRSVLYVAGSYNGLRHPTVEGDFATLKLLMSYGANVNALDENSEGGLFAMLRCQRRLCRTCPIFGHGWGSCQLGG